MKLIAIFSFLLMALMGCTSAQRCVPGNPSCTGPRDVGRRGRGCIAGRMFYYDARRRQCREMQYLGCGGNRNRWCTRTACEQRCRRR